MDIKLDTTDRSEILRYLGYRGSEITEVVEDTLKEGIKLSNKLIKIGMTYRFLNIIEKDTGVEVVGENFTLLGEAIRKHLKGYDRAMFFCLTIGSAFDREVEKQMVKNPTLAVILNACGIQAVEKACDALQLQAEEETGMKTGVRFSPGYGDLPLATQKDFIRILNTERLAGVTINENYLMNPRKTVTAVCGLKKEA
ncbi:MAG: hypothetical protein J5626_09160 [Lachnospiraceae bacterium]|nr:hypothetical protein [Lachnospiraceae bacterium]